MASKRREIGFLAEDGGGGGGGGRGCFMPQNTIPISVTDRGGGGGKRWLKSLLVVSNVQVFATQHGRLDRRTRLTYIDPYATHGSRGRGWAGQGGGGDQQNVTFISTESWYSEHIEQR